MELETLNLSQICRTCKSVTLHMRSVFEGYEDLSQGPRIDEMLMACTSVQVSCGDGLPAQICQVCVEQLNNAFVFKKQCEEIDASLRKYAKNLKVNEIKHEVKQELQDSDFIESLNSLNSTLNEQSSSDSLHEEPSVSTITSEIETCNQMLKDSHCHKRIHTGKMYKCGQCDKLYTRLDHFQKHEKSHGPRKVHVCRICSKTLTRPDHLKRHLMTHLKEKPYSCSTCKRGFTRIEHLQNHQHRCKGDAVFLCDICNRAFNREDSLEVHKTTHENQQLRLPTIDNLGNIEEHYYQIDQDSDASKVDNSFKSQVTTIEGLEYDCMKEVEDMSLNDDESNATDTSLECVVDNDNVDSSMEMTVKNLEHVNVDNMEVKVEDYSLSVEVTLNEDNPLDLDNVAEDSMDNANSESLLEEVVSTKTKRGRAPMKRKVPGKGRHRQSTQSTKTEENVEEYGEFSCPACQEVFNTMSALDSHARINHEGLKMYKCKVCSKEFSRAIYLKRHITSHSNDRLFQCTTCPMSFNRRDHLNQHQKLHEKSNNFECEICQRTFKQADLLAKHKNFKHAIGEKIQGKKYQCPLCHKHFTSERYRDIHVDGHNKQKEYHCKVCEEAFLSKAYLAKHMKSHDDQSKKILCSECGQRFVRNDYLIIHMRRHRGEKPFKCKYCGKGFPRTSDLTVHERCHTGEKTHLCTVCGKGFGRAYYLTVHMRTHTGEKPYKCTYCESAFAQRNDCNSHIRRRHAGEQYNQVNLTKK